jgi:hypothetical protein
MVKMGAAKKNTPKKPAKVKTSRTRRAGLHFPVHMVRKELKARLGPKRNFEKGVEVVYTALVEHLVERLLVNASERITKGNYIDATHLHDVMTDKDGEVAKVFPQHVTGLY